MKLSFCSREEAEGAVLHSLLPWIAAGWTLREMSIRRMRLGFVIVAEFWAPRLLTAGMGAR